MTLRGEEGQGSGRISAAEPPKEQSGLCTDDRRWFMPTDKIRKYILPNIPYLFIGWARLKPGTAYRLATGAGFGEKLLGLGRSIGPAFADFAPGLNPFDCWLASWVRWPSVC